MKKRWSRLSIKVRLILWYTTVLMIVLAINGVVILTLLQNRRYADLDRQLKEDMEVTEQMIQVDSQGALVWRADYHNDDDEDTGLGIMVEAWSRQGDLLLRRDSPGIGNLPNHPRLGTAGPSFASVRTSHGISARVVTWPYSINGLPVVIRIARPEEKIKGELTQVLLVIILAFLFAAGFAGIGGYILAGRVLAPLNRIIERAKMISAENLSDRLPVDNPDDELGQLTGVLNETFSRLDRAFKELRRFTSDASHELRTPLTAIRSVGEVGLRKASDERTYRDTISSMLEEVDRLSRMVDNLLTLSRADSEAIQLEKDHVKLEDLAQEVIDYLSVLAEEKNQSLVMEVVESVDALADRGLLRHAIINLVDNAIKYSPPSSTVRVVVKAVRGCPVLEVIDAGPGIPPEHRDHIFERFYRVDKARSRKTDGTGLGLAIAKWAVEANGGRIELETEEGAGSVFRVVLPATRPPSKGAKG
jgi:heavy metal sensor kinase